MNAAVKIDPPASSRRREIKGFCTLCKSRCGEINIVEDDRLIEVRPDPSHPTGKALCAKGRAAPEIVHSTERLLYPLRRTTPKTSADPGWRRVTWAEALDDIAKRMNAIREKHGAEAVAFSTTTASGSSIADVKPWIERFAWAFGSPNVGSSAELCDTKDSGHEITLGRGIALPDFANTDLAVMWGYNPTHVWLAAAEALTEAHRRGAGLVVVDPRRTPLAAQADLWLRVRPGTDGILAMATAALVLESGGYDDDFVRRWTNAPFLVRSDNGRLLRARDVWGDGAGEFVVWQGGRAVPYNPARAADRSEAQGFALEGLVQVPTKAGNVAAEPAFAIYKRAVSAVTPARAADETGIPAAQIEAFAERLSAARSACYYTWTGVGQHADAAQIDRGISTLFALKGQADAPGGNVAWPTPPTNRIDDLGLLTPEQRAKALGFAERPLSPARRAWVTAGDLYRAMLYGQPYPVRALVAFGSNPLASRSEPELGREALASLDLQVHCDLFANPTANTADYLLPSGTPWEREVLRVGFEISADAQRLVQLRPAIVPPQGESRSDFWIAAQLAKRTGCGGALFDADWSRALEYVLEPTGLKLGDLRANPEGVRLDTPNPYKRYAAENADGVRGFATETRRVEIYSEALHRLGQPPVPAARAPAALTAEFPLRLTGGKAGHFNHSQHRQIAALRRRSTQPLFQLSSAAAAARGVTEGDPIEIRTQHGRIRAIAGVDPYIADDVVFGFFGWWQACEDLGEPGYPLSGEGSANYNLLTSTAETDPVLHTPAIKSTPCQVTRVADAVRRWTGFESLEVAATRRLTHDVTLVELRRFDRGTLPGFQAGQFITVQPAGQSEARSYSLVGRAEERPRRYVIAVRHEPRWRVSPRMAALAAGDAIMASAPSGRFTLPIRHTRPVVFIAFGIGITPFMSQLSSLPRVSDGAKVYLHYSATTPAAQPFHRRIQRLERMLPNLEVTNWYTGLASPSPPPPGARAGRFDVEALPQDLIDRRARFYLCGGRTAVAELRAALIARGVPRFEIFEERFVSPGRTGVPEDGKTHRIHLAKSQRDVTWNGKASILDTLVAAGVNAPSGCRVGQCESCAVRLLEGAVAYVAQPEDLDDSLCLTCTAAPTSDIVLDL